MILKNAKKIFVILKYFNGIWKNLCNNSISCRSSNLNWSVITHNQTSFSSRWNHQCIGNESEMKKMTLILETMGIIMYYNNMYLNLHIRFFIKYRLSLGLFWIIFTLKLTKKTFWKKLFNFLYYWKFVYFDSWVYGVVHRCCLKTTHLHNVKKMSKIKSWRTFSASSIGFFKQNVIQNWIMKNFDWKMFLFCLEYELS